ncbi:MAG: WbuC family cupin fold metalloprotein [Candidatus Omnitrophica bacterium]|nr:WbuC family cupin fold metalloprotein [Candidatus Omnitrophota bacterium]MDD5436169.1 WbuC family cupin fold metalloprotein [Candidatus Omnitrophota bacterium]
MIKITEDLIGKVSDEAKASPRRRTNYNFHQTDDAVLQRMLNAAEPGTYIQPHKHEDPDKTEIFIILKGSVAVVEFDDAGKVTDHVILDAALGAGGVEIPPRVWHSFITLKPGSVLYEVKEGPYDKHADKAFAAWAPAEGSKDALEFNRNVLARLNIKTE